MDASSPDANLAVPESEAFPRYPQSWYWVCSSGDLPRGKAVAARLCGRSLVVFRTARDRLGALAARCPHLGADLSSGHVVGDRIQCPHHRFQFDPKGNCPEQGLQATAYPAEERYGAIFVFHGATPLFPLPRFPDNDNLVSAEPVHWKLNTQWYMIAGNAFDARHFVYAHDRRIVTPPRVSAVGRFALRIEYEYEIAGTTWTDRATRYWSGSRVDFGVTAWGGNIMLVTARFKRDQSFGFVVAEPQYPPSAGAGRGVRMTVIVNASSRGSSLAAHIMDRLVVSVKRFAIRRMLMGDAQGLMQLDYVSSGLRAGDEALAHYLRWVAGLPAAEISEPQHSIT
jgi:nitrite reductase/ring-hydroxylating ferredoxin subunit